MSFTYNSVHTRPNTSVAWFKDANNSAYSSIIAAVQSSPGYVSGTWQQDPADPTRFLISHTWTSKAAWKTMSDSLKSLAAMQLSSGYRNQNNISTAVTLSE